MRKDGSEFPVEVSLSPMESDEGTLVIAAIRDVTESRKAQERIRYLNRVYAMLSGINTLIVRASSREDLFKQACEIAVDGGFSMAMIAMVDKKTLKLVPVASQGKDDELLSSIKGILSSDETASKTMGMRAIRGKQVIAPTIHRGIRRCGSGPGTPNPAGTPWPVPLLRVQRMRGGGGGVGRGVDFFHGEELKLLTEVGRGISRLRLITLKSRSDSPTSPTWGRLRKRKIKHAKPVAAVVAA
ncbi:MAG: PAS domain S-box protein [Simplicispira sp.]|nr:PAS domain S-box protein [Simplicispira sp.]